MARPQISAGKAVVIKGEKGDPGKSIDYSIEEHRVGFKREDEEAFRYTEDLRPEIVTRTIRPTGRKYLLGKIGEILDLRAYTDDERQLEVSLATEAYENNLYLTSLVDTSNLFIELTLLEK